MGRKTYPQEYLYPLLTTQSLEVQLIVQGKGHLHQIPEPSAYKTRKSFDRALRGVLNLTEGEFIHCPGMERFASILWEQGTYTRNCEKIKLEERRAKRREKLFREEVRYRSAVR